MGKSHKRFSKEECDEIVCVPLDEIFVSDSTWRKLLASDHGQIAKMRENFESGRRTVRVVLRPRMGGGYNIEDGRHRVIAAKQAEIGYIEAIIVGS